MKSRGNRDQDMWPRILYDVEMLVDDTARVYGRRNCLVKYTLILRSSYMHAAVNVQITSTSVMHQKSKQDPPTTDFHPSIQILAASCCLFAIFSLEDVSVPTILPMSLALPFFLLVSLPGRHDRHSHSPSASPIVLIVLANDYNVSIHSSDFLAIPSAVAGVTLTFAVAFLASSMSFGSFFSLLLFCCISSVRGRENPTSLCPPISSPPISISGRQHALTNPCATCLSPSRSGLPGCSKASHFVCQQQYS